MFMSLFLLWIFSETSSSRWVPYHLLQSMQLNVSRVFWILISRMSGYMQLSNKRFRVYMHLIFVVQNASGTVIPQSKFRNCYECNCPSYEARVYNFIKLTEDGSHIISIITPHALGLGASITLTKKQWDL